MQPSDWAVVLYYAWPVILIPAGWLVLGRLCRERAASGASMIELREQHLAETHRMSAVMERIAAVLEKNNGK
ncbi:hypothetical protein XH96_34970 [Bradyrhizobium sp. CCBAU 51765]|nr:hypothetical protein XH96_34970 [Bradyrhizobium sp. CCBAU 51765]